jgi:hypothetical protein
MESSNEELQKYIGRRITFYDGKGKPVVTGIFKGFKDCRFIFDVGLPFCNNCKGMLILSIIKEHKEGYKWNEFNDLSYYCLSFNGKRRWKVEKTETYEEIFKYLEETKQKPFFHRK